MEKIDEEKSGTRPLAIVTGASSGIGYHLATECAKHGFDLILAADEDGLDHAAEQCRAYGVSVMTLKLDLSLEQSVDALCAIAKGRPVDALLANAGHGLGDAFLDQDFKAARHVLDTNVTGTIYLIHKVGREMRARGRGRILITGSIAGFIPGSYHAVYNGTKAFIDSFALALRNELKDSGVTVTCLMPGATDTHFFARAHMLDTKVAAAKKDDPAEVAKIGFEGMMKGRGDVVSGLKNKVQSAVAGLTPSAILAEQHRRLAEPGGART